MFLAEEAINKEFYRLLKDKAPGLVGELYKPRLVIKTTWANAIPVLKQFNAIVWGCASDCSLRLEIWPVIYFGYGIAMGWRHYSSVMGSVLF